MPGQNDATGPHSWRTEVKPARLCDQDPESERATPSLTQRLVSSLPTGREPLAVRLLPSFRYNAAPTSDAEVRR